MEFDDKSVDLSGVDDRRGRGGAGKAAAGGGGLIALIIAILVATGVIGGGGGGLGALDPNALNGIIQPQGASETTEELSARCTAEGALDEYTDCRLIKAYNVVNDTWSEEFTAEGREYRPPGLVFFSQATETGGCGPASAETGPFYCPPDETIYFDLDFLAELQDRFGAQGKFAQVYILAHEAGHHLQTVLGIEPQVRARQQQDPGSANDLSVRTELQADCLAGVWTTLADANEGEGLVLSRDDITEALGAASAVGDDRIQQATQGRVNPESFTHGSSEQRQRWFTTGYEAGTIDACDTFAAASL